MKKPKAMTVKWTVEWKDEDGTWKKGISFDSKEQAKEYKDISNWMTDNDHRITETIVTE